MTAPSDPVSAATSPPRGLWERLRIWGEMIKFSHSIFALPFAVMAAFLARALDLAPGVGDPFSDDDGSVFETSIGALAAAGITRGCNPPVNDRFCPESAVTRGQMAAFLSRGSAG